MSQERVLVVFDPERHTATVTCEVLGEDGQVESRYVYYPACACDDNLVSAAAWALDSAFPRLF